MRFTFKYFRASLLLLTAAALFQSCDENQVICTEEFRTVEIRVIGEELTEHFTIRESTSDTIRHTDNGGFPDIYYYIVLTDSYQSSFAGSRENFRFIGKQGNLIKVNELYVIEADQCHISYVSGTTEVNL